MQVYGIDNLNDYYDVNLKKIYQLHPQAGFTFQFLDLADRDMLELFQQQKFDYVVNLAASGSASLENPFLRRQSRRFCQPLEGCRQSQIKHLVFASSSSVYGANTKVPFSVSDNVDHPISLYAATKGKRANRSRLQPSVRIADNRTALLHGLRSLGRPDMAYFKFVKAISEGCPINVYNFGK